MTIPVTDLSAFHKIPPDRANRIGNTAIAALVQCLDGCNARMGDALMTLTLATAMLARMGNYSEAAIHEQLNAAWCNIDIDKRLAGMVAEGRRRAVVKTEG